MPVTDGRYEDTTRSGTWDLGQARSTALAGMYEYAFTIVTQKKRKAARVQDESMG